MSQGVLKRKERRHYPCGNQQSSLQDLQISTDAPPEVEDKPSRVFHMGGCIFAVITEDTSDAVITFHADVGNSALLDQAAGT